MVVVVEGIERLGEDSLALVPNNPEKLEKEKEKRINIDFMFSKNRILFLCSYKSEICVVPSLKSLCISTTGTPKILLGTIDVGSQSSLNIRHSDFDVDVSTEGVAFDVDEELFSCTVC